MNKFPLTWSQVCCDLLEHMNTTGCCHQLVRLAMVCNKIYFVHQGLEAILRCTFLEETHDNDSQDLVLYIDVPVY